MIIENNQNREYGNQALITEEVNSHLARHAIKPVGGFSVWENPMNGNLYAGSHFNCTELKENIISNSKVVKAAWDERKKKGALGEEFDTIGLFSQRFQPLAEAYFKKAREDQNLAKMGINKNTFPEVVAVAATTTIGEDALRPDQLSLIERTNIANMLMILGEKDYVAQDIFPRKNVDFIKGTRFKRTGLSVQKGIKVGTQVRIKNVEFSDKTYEISGIGIGIAKHWETGFVPTYLNAFQETINAIPNALTKAKAEIARDALQAWGGATAFPGARWDSITTSGTSTNRPLDDLEAAALVLQGYGIASRVFGHIRTVTVYEHNTWNNGGTPPAVIANKGRAKMMQHDGYTFIGDSIATSNADVYVYTEDAGQTYVGPRQIFPFENPEYRFAGQYLIEYIGSQIEETLKVTKITGVDG